MITILIVEDEKLIAADEKNILENLGYTVAGIASTGDEAVKMAENVKPDLVLMDIALKGNMDGIEAARVITQESFIPIVFITSYSDPNTLEKAKKIQPYGFITKPFKIDMLQSTIEMAVYKHEMDRKLCESEEKYRILFNSIFDPVLIFNPESLRIIDCNVETQNFYEYSYSELVSMSILDLFPQNKIDEIKYKLFPENGKASFHAYQMSKSGKLKSLHVSVNNTDYFGSQAKICIMRDVTEIESISSELTRERQLFNTFMNNTADSIYFKDKDSRYIMINSALSKIFNLENPLQAKGKTDYDFFTEEYAKTAHYDENEIIKSKKIIKKEEKETWKDNKVTWMSTVKGPIFNKYGTIMGTFGISRDITNQKEAEDGVTRTQIELNNIFNMASEGMRVIDKNFNVLRVNNTLLDLLGKTETEILGFKCYETFHCNLCHTLACPLFTVNRNSKQIENEVYYKNSKDQRYTFILSASPFRDADGKFVGIIESLRNISERKMLEARLAQSQKLESIGQLAAGIAHEINTPAQYVDSNIYFLKETFSGLLSTLNGYRNIIEETGLKDIKSDMRDKLQKIESHEDFDFLTEEIPAAIEQSIEGIRRISNIVKAMKEFSHPGSKEKSSVDINKALETTLTVARNEWKYIADIKTDFQTDLPQINCLSDECNQVFLNVIINAAHAISDAIGGECEEKGMITVSTMKNGSYVEIHISDTGGGIPEEIQDRIFDPFFTTKDPGKGTGQGLAISYDVIVRKHNGLVNFTTEQGKGTTFVISLPL